MLLSELNSTQKPKQLKQGHSVFKTKLSTLQPIKQTTLYLEFDVVTDELISLHELPLVAAVLGDHGEGVMDRGAQDAHQGLDPRVRVHVRQVGLHDVTGS